MTLVIQIALGIVLAAVILAFWRQLLALGFGLLLLALVLGALGFGVVRVSNKVSVPQNSEELGAYVLVVTVVSLLAWGLMWLTEKLTNRKPKDSQAQHGEGSIEK